VGAHLSLSLSLSHSLSLSQTGIGQTICMSVRVKSAITDHAVEENHVIDWDSAEVVARGAQ